MGDAVTPFPMCTCERGLWGPLWVLLSAKDKDPGKAELRCWGEQERTRREMRGRRGRWWRRRAQEARNEVYLLHSARNPLIPPNSRMESLILVDTLCVWPFCLVVKIPTTCDTLGPARRKVQQSSHTNQGILVTLSKITLSTYRSPHGGFSCAFWSLSKSVRFAILKRQF